MYIQVQLYSYNNLCSFCFDQILFKRMLCVCIVVNVMAWHNTGTMVKAQIKKYTIIYTIQKTNKQRLLVKISCYSDKDIVNLSSRLLFLTITHLLYFESQYISLQFKNAINTVDIIVVYCIFANWTFWFLNCRKSILSFIPSIK